MATVVGAGWRGERSASGDDVSARQPPPGQRGTAPSRQALRLALRPDGGAFAAWAPAHIEAVDWHWVLRCAQAHKVAPLLAARVRGCGLDAALDAGLPRRLLAVRIEATQRAEM
ncbi:MAG: hypothetical protein ABI624_22175, partial [Casimicrobiaceae bacterium]